MFDKDVTQLVVASLGNDGQLGERTTGVKLVTKIRQQQSQTTSELEELNGTVPIGVFVTRDDCTRT